MRKQIKTRKLEIKKYWFQKLKRIGKIENIKRCDFLKKDYCFSCLRVGPRLDRAHILAHSLGGEDMPPNLHLLCSACHHQSEEYSGERYWYWFEKQNAIHSILYDITRYSGLSTQKIVRFFMRDKIEGIIKSLGIGVDLDLSRTEDVACLLSSLKLFLKTCDDPYKKEIESTYYDGTKNEDQVS